MILIKGLPVFAKRVSKLLNRYDIKAQVFGSRFIDKVCFLFNIPFSQSVISVSGNHKSFFLPVYCKVFRKKYIVFWCGSDVDRAVVDYKNDKFTLKNKIALKCSKHYCEVPWIKEKLESIGIESEILINGNVIFQEEEFSISPFPEKFKVFTYLGKGKEEFYGLGWLKKLAKDFFDVEFVVIGTDNYSLFCDAKNITLLGWVDDVDRVVKDNVIYLRLTQRDSIGNLVLFSAINGRYVIRTKYIDNISITVKSYDELYHAINEKIQNFNFSSLPLNDKCAELKKYREKNVISNILEVL
ncbi:hypothetical protein EBI01_18985 [Marinomonas rhizomae]|uniref:Glycosyl transferase family 1 n=1 Tax=Marinomonas rhizomae TaxID=491948 RepID=A0A366J8J3_9GAMM|nr:hypothetical protein [Marinomonas rhizomae]RBP83273.1 hypothetical protein DFP80_107252 [Marinomonas rhizomae]RNF69389.1 hypothetical protein EBI01_18985 [Marinomonas rhizomae]